MGNRRKCDPLFLTIIQEARLLGSTTMLIRAKLIFSFLVCDLPDNICFFFLKLNYLLKKISLEWLNFFRSTKGGFTFYIKLRDNASSTIECWAPEIEEHLLRWINSWVMNRRLKNIAQLILVNQDSCRNTWLCFFVRCLLQK